MPASVWTPQSSRKTRFANCKASRSMVHSPSAVAPALCSSRDASKASALSVRVIGGIPPPNGWTARGRRAAPGSHGAPARREGQPREARPTRGQGACVWHRSGTQEACGRTFPIGKGNYTTQRFRGTSCVVTRTSQHPTDSLPCGGQPPIKPPRLGAASAEGASTTRRPLEAMQDGLHRGNAIDVSAPAWGADDRHAPA